MKKILIIIPALAIALLMQSAGCRNNDPVVPSGCGDIACTMQFAMVTVEVQYNNGSPVILDEYYTLREKTGEKIVSQSHIPDSGTYVVLDDNFIATLTNNTESFRFIGKKNGAEVVNELYQLSGDCCHVNKQSGKSTITIQ